MSYKPKWDMETCERAMHYVITRVCRVLDDISITMGYDIERKVTWYIEYMLSIINRRGIKVFLENYAPCTLVPDSDNMLWSKNMNIHILDMDNSWNTYCILKAMSNPEELPISNITKKTGVIIPPDSNRENENDAIGLEERITFNCGLKIHLPTADDNFREVTEGVRFKYPLDSFERCLREARYNLTSNSI